MSMTTYPKLYVLREYLDDVLFHHPTDDKKDGVMWVVMPMPGLIINAAGAAQCVRDGFQPIDLQPHGIKLRMTVRRTQPSDWPVLLQKSPTETIAMGCDDMDDRRVETRGRMAKYTEVPIPSVTYTLGVNVTKGDAK